ncbi:MAG: hypothetical protein ACE5EO_09695, partial [Candidatus Krumholzibacteriia bacterium]
KKVAEAAGLGKIGIHRNVIHSTFGSFIFLGTVLIDREVAEYGRQINFDPCLSYKLCVAAAAAENSHEGFASAPGRIWQVFPVVAHGVRASRLEIPSAGGVTRVSVKRPGLYGLNLQEGFGLAKRCQSSCRDDYPLYHRALAFDVNARRGY